MRKLFSDSFGILRHAQYEFENEAERNGNQWLTTNGKEQCKKLGLLLTDVLSKATNKILFVTSPIQRALLTTQEISSILSRSFEVIIEKADWLTEDQKDITDENISHYLQEDVFVIFVSHYPDIQSYMRFSDIGLCEFISNIAHIKDSTLSDKLSDNKVLEKKLNILHRLLGQKFDLDETDMNLLHSHGIKDIDTLKNTKWYSAEFNKELSRIRDLLLQDID